MNDLGIAYLCWAAWFLGLGGLHRLYNGKVGSGILWLMTFGLFGVGQFVDLVLIPKMVEEHNLKAREKLGISALGWSIYQPNVILEAVQPKLTRDQLMVRLLKTAYTKGGKLSVTQGVMATGASFAEVEAALKEMLKTGYVSAYNDPVTGIVIYDFHEL